MKFTEIKNKHEMAYICLKAVAPVCIGEGLRMILRKATSARIDDSPSLKQDVADWLFIVACATLIMESLKTLINFILFKKRERDADCESDKGKCDSKKSTIHWRTKIFDITFIVPGALASLSTFLHWAALCRLTAAMAEPLKLAAVPLITMMSGVIFTVLRGTSMMHSSESADSPFFLMLASSLLLLRCLWGDGTHVPYGAIATIFLSIMTKNVSEQFLKSYVQPRAKNIEVSNVHLDAFLFHFWSVFLSIIIVIVTGAMDGLGVLQHVRHIGVPMAWLTTGIACETALLYVSLPPPTAMRNGRPLLRRLVVWAKLVIAISTVLLSFLLLASAAPYFAQPVFLVGLSFNCIATWWRSHRSLTTVYEVIAKLDQMCIDREKAFEMRRQMMAKMSASGEPKQHKLTVNYDMEMEIVEESADSDEEEYLLRPNEDRYIPDNVDFKSANKTANKDDDDSIV